MMGLYFLVLIGGYIWIVSKIRKRVHPYWGKVLVVVVAILIPTADHMYGKIKLWQMCNSEGGLHIYRVVEGVDGLYLPFRTGGDSWWLEKQGYKFIEERGEVDGTYDRISLQPDGTYLHEKGVAPISKYAYESSGIVDINETFSRIDKFVRVRDTGEILSRFTDIYYAGGWFSRLYRSVGMSGGSCKQNVRLDELITKTLKPIQTNSTQ